jgi:hypothetical protein
MTTRDSVEAEDVKFELRLREKILWLRLLSEFGEEG